MPDYLSDKMYKAVTENVPIICVDIILVRSGSVGVIVRATGSQAGKLTVLGGRIYHSETINDAIARHLMTDLGVKNYKIVPPNDIAHPFLVQQYFMQDNIESSEHGFDPSKHAITLAYLIETEDRLNPKNEASDIRWINNLIEDPKVAGYNQAVVINKALSYLQNK